MVLHNNEIFLNIYLKYWKKIETVYQLEVSLVSTIIIFIDTVCQ